MGPARLSSERAAGALSAPRPVRIGRTSSDGGPASVGHPGGRSEDGPVGVGVPDHFEDEPHAGALDTHWPARHPPAAPRPPGARRERVGVSEDDARDGAGLPAPVALARHGHHEPRRPPGKGERRRGTARSTRPPSARGAPHGMRGPVERRGRGRSPIGGPRWGRPGSPCHGSRDIRARLRFPERLVVGRSSVGRGLVPRVREARGRLGLLPGREGGRRPTDVP